MVLAVTIKNNSHLSHIFSEVLIITHLYKGDLLCGLKASIYHLHIPYFHSHSLPRGRLRTCKFTLNETKHFSWQQTMFQPNTLNLHLQRI